MEALLNGKGNNSTYRSSNTTIFAVTFKAITIHTFDVNGISIVVSFGHRVGEGSK